MAIPIQDRFEIAAPLAQVWAFFQDPAQVANCLPGAQLTRVVDEKTYQGKVQVQVGLVKAQFQGTAVIERMDPATWTAEMVATADQVGAAGQAQARATFTLVPLGEARTEVSVRAEVAISGRLAQLGGAMIQPVAKQLFRRFADCARQKIISPPAP